MERWVFREICRKEQLLVSLFSCFIFIFSLCFSSWYFDSLRLLLSCCFPLVHASACECPLLTREETIAAADIIFVGTAEQTSEENGRNKTLFLFSKDGEIFRKWFYSEWYSRNRFLRIIIRNRRTIPYLCTRISRRIFTDLCAGNKMNPGDVKIFLGKPDVTYTDVLDIPETQPSSLEEEAIFPDVSKQSDFRDCYFVSSRKKKYYWWISRWHVPPWENHQSCRLFVKLVTLSVFSESEIESCKTSKNFQMFLQKVGLRRMFAWR